MRIYWNIDSVPELQGLTFPDRESILRHYRQHRGASTRPLALTGAIALSTFLLMLVSCVFFDFGFPSLMVILMVVGIVVLILNLYTTFQEVRAARKYFRWFRSNQLECLQCQYNLTGNLSGRCPECGHLMLPPLESSVEKQI